MKNAKKLYAYLMSMEQPLITKPIRLYSVPRFENCEKSKEVVTNENSVRPPFNEKVIKKDAF